MVALETSYDNLLGQIGRLGPDGLEAALQGAAKDLSMVLVDESDGSDTQWIATLADGDQRLELSYFRSSHHVCRGQAAALRIVQGEDLLTARSWDFDLPATA